MTENVFTTGRCLCGAVSYEITGEPVRMAACQRSSGTGHVPLARV